MLLNPVIKAKYKPYFISAVIFKMFLGTTLHLMKTGVLALLPSLC